MDFKRKQKGFTLIELLVVIAVIGVLASIILVRVNEARAKSRDARRISDLRQTKTGLEMYYTAGEGYPDMSAWNNAVLGGTLIGCGEQNFFMPPDDPLDYPYIYTSDGNSSSGCGGEVWSSFEIEFDTESAGTLGPAGTYFLTPGGFTAASQLSAAAKSKKVCPPKSKGKGCAK